MGVPNCRLTHVLNASQVVGRTVSAALNQVRQNPTLKNKPFWNQNCLGYCLGSNVGVTGAYSAETCLSQCNANPDCVWFTFHSTDKVCSLTSDCQWVDDTCGDTCVHGRKGCKPTEEIDPEDRKNRDQSLPIDFWSVLPKEHYPATLYLRA